MHILDAWVLALSVIQPDLQSVHVSSVGKGVQLVVIGKWTGCGKTQQDRSWQCIDASVAQQMLWDLNCFDLPLRATIQGRMHASHIRTCKTIAVAQ